jgi:Ca2+-binding EF-hand superfamily protein
MEIGPGALKNYKAAFSILDLDNSGSIDEEELIVGLQSVGLDPTPEQVRGMLFQADVDRSGQIDLAEFIVVMTNEQKKQKESRLFC